MPLQGARVPLAPTRWIHFIRVAFAFPPASLLSLCPLPHVGSVTVSAGLLFRVLAALRLWIVTVSAGPLFGVLAAPRRGIYFVFTGCLFVCLIVACCSLLFIFLVDLSQAYVDLLFPAAKSAEAAALAGSAGGSGRKAAIAFWHACQFACKLAS